MSIRPPVISPPARRTLMTGAERAVSSVDYPQSVVASYTYDLPIGTGKKLLNGRDVFSRYIAAGWSFSAIQSYRSGGPLGVFTNTRLPATGDTLALSNPTIRPNRVSGVAPRTGLTCSGFDPGRDIYLSRAGFLNPSPFTFGNAPGPVERCSRLPRVQREPVGHETSADYRKPSRPSVLSRFLQCAESQESRQSVHQHR